MSHDQIPVVLDAFINRKQSPIKPNIYLKKSVYFKSLPLLRHKSIKKNQFIIMVDLNVFFFFLTILDYQANLMFFMG